MVPFASTREMVRAVLITPACEVLLMRMAFPWFASPVWIAPGGGVEDGESVERALHRELAEELGRDDFAFGPQLWERAFTVEHACACVHAHERYFVASTEPFAPRPAFEAHEQAWFRGFRWWHVDELLAGGVETSPEDLPALLARFAATVNP